jgi:ribose 5-phosphate isomerase B
VGQRLHSADFVKELIDTFIGTKFPGDERHVRRIEKISNYEVTGEI